MLSLESGLPARRTISAVSSFLLAKVCTKVSVMTAKRRKEHKWRKTQIFWNIHLISASIKMFLHDKRRISTLFKSYFRQNVCLLMSEFILLQRFVKSPRTNTTTTTTTTKHQTKCFSQTRYKIYWTLNSCTTNKSIWKMFVYALEIWQSGAFTLAKSRAVI